MKLSNDISPEELSVFLEETDEELKLLDEDLILLEKSGLKPEIIQEIFRAAHTLKGSSAMLGYKEMSQVAHAMETILDMLRSGKLAISTEIINALLSGLDMLKQLRQELVSDSDSTPVDVTQVSKMLEKIAGKTTAVSSTATEVKSNVTTHDNRLETVSTQAQERESCNIQITFTENSEWIAVRQFQVLTELARVGVILNSIPSKSEIEAGNVGKNMTVQLSDPFTSDEIKQALSEVEDISAVEILSANGEIAAGTVAVQAKSEALQSSEPSQSSTVAQTAKKNTQTSESVRVDVKLLDNLMNLVGEMVIDRNRIRQISRDLELKYENDEIVETLGETSVHMVKLVSDLQENILRARMLHIGTIFNGFPRLVRDLAQKANKKIDFSVEGQETELDRSIIEQIKDPLVHLLRNSVDHGIEPSTKRKLAGKPEIGTIRLRAYHEQSYIVVCVSDDGCGIDIEKVKRAAVNKGFISTEEAARLSTAEAHNLIFLNGVSTADKITEVSGRGVGMDIVKTNISNVGGAVSVESKPGVGTTIKIRLPLTLATIDGIMVSSGGFIYVIPISAIVEILRLKTDQIQGVLGKEVFRLREDVIPLVRLSERFSQESARTDFEDEINIVVIKAGDKLSGLIVDAVLEPQESVVKPLGKYLGSLPGISGATIMGDGQVALILDTATLVKEK
jgi:two-component system, chemotaxis family, sensor kinase CheA